MKRQQTEWIWNQIYTKGTFIRVGWIHNKNKGVKLDRIRVQVHSLHCDLDFNMRLDEAAGLIAGLGKVICRETLAGRFETKEETPAKDRKVET